MPEFKTYILIGLVALITCPLTVLGQVNEEFTEEVEYQSNVKPPVQIEGNAKELSKTLKEAIITLYEDPDGSKTGIVEIKKLVTKGNGKFAFDLDINKMYVIKVEKDGYTTKMVDFDTDVTMAASTETKVPKFMFDVDLVKDLDGLDYVGAVARVFYDIRKRSMAYELDYTKEEQIEEERLARLAEEQQRQAELEAQQKFEREEAAKMLLETEGMEAAEIIKATATIGGDEAKVKESLRKIYPQSDSLRNRKVDIIYAELEKEKKKQGGTTANINFQSIFKSAQEFEVQHMKEMTELEDKRKAEILNASLAVKQAQSEALAKANASSQLEARERIAAAAAQEDLRQKEEKAQKVESYYQAIFSANGNPETAIKNLEKQFGRDLYKEEKAAAVYAEYENMRKTGSTLSSMNFDNLFAAASTAEMVARENESRTKDQADSARLAAFMAKVENRKKEEEEAVVKKIEQAIKGSNGERAETIKALQAAFSKNDPYKEQKAQAVYDSYAESRQINQGGSNYSAIDFNSLFAVAQQTENDAKEKKKNDRFAEKQKQWEELEAKRASVRNEKRELGVRSEQEAQVVHKKVLGDLRTKKYKALEDAIAQGGGERENTVEALMETLPEDAEFRREKAEAMFDAYRLQKNAVGGVSNIRYQDMFAAANQKEIDLLEQQYEEKKADEFAHLRKYEETRLVRAEEIAQAKVSKAEQERQKAEEQYLAVAKKMEEERRARLEEEKKQQILFQREQFEKQNVRIASEQERLGEIQANELAAAKRRQETLEAENRKKAEAQRKEEERLALERQKQLDALEAERLKAVDAQKKEELRLQKEALQKADAEAKAAAKLAQEKLKEEQRIAAEAQKKKDEEALALAAERDKKNEEDYLRFLTLGNQAFDKKDYANARIQYDQGLTVKPNGKEIKDKLKDLVAIEKEIAKGEREAQALEDRYNNQIETAELAFEVGDYEQAIAAYNRALKEKPRAKEPREKITQIETLKRQLAAADKEKAAKEREYMLLLQDGNNLMTASKYAEAKNKYEQALDIKPNESVPQTKIAEANEQLALIADAEEKERIRKAEAKRAFEAQAAAEKAKADAEAEKLAAEKAARQQVLQDIDTKATSANEEIDTENLTAEQARQKKYEAALKRVEEMNLDAETQRLAFLSELAQIYPEGITEETVNGKGFTLARNVVNINGVVTVYEKKIWDWGGVFYFKDTDIAITEALYNLELKSYK